MPRSINQKIPRRPKSNHNSRKFPIKICLKAANGFLTEVDVAYFSSFEHLSCHRDRSLFFLRGIIINLGRTKLIDHPRVGLGELSL